MSRADGRAGGALAGGRRPGRDLRLQGLKLLQAGAGVLDHLPESSRIVDELLGLVAPDWTAIHWNEPPTYLDEAKKMWGVQQ